MTRRRCSREIARGSIGFGVKLELKDRELQELRGQLREIHTSDAWAMLRTMTQVRHALAPTVLAAIA